jgi:hypothetical protein
MKLFCRKIDPEKLHAHALFPLTISLKWAKLAKKFSFTGGIGIDFPLFASR